MQIVSVNVGMPQSISVGEASVLTSIFKSPVSGRVAVRRHNLDGDRQSDLTVHGGPHKAVYAYPSEHYRYWHEELPEMDLPYGVFGENLTTSGLTESNVCIGDEFRFGSAVLGVTQPRMPCYKLGIRFELSDMVKRFWQSGRSGIYFSVIEEGDLAAGDSIEQISQGREGITVADVLKLYRGDESDPELLERALQSPLTGSWKEELRERQWR